MGKINHLILIILFLAIIPAGALAMYGNITISSSPAGAAIYLDTVDTGQVTTATVENIQAGSHTIWLHLSGYNDSIQNNVIVANDTTNSLTFTLSSTTAAPIISSITPSTGYNTSTVDITSLAGSGFSTSTNPTVRLYRAGSNNITGIITSTTSTILTCTFDLTNKQAGAWDVVVINPTGESYTLSNGFTILSVASDATLTSITPASSVTNTTVSITSLAGTNFNGTPSVYLKRSGYNDVPGTFTRSSATLLTGTFNLTRVVPGPYQVCVVNTGASAVCGLTFTVTSMVTAANGTLYFKSSPTGANVYVNSVHRGTTPLYLDVAPGSYVIKLQKESYLDWADRVAVTSNNQTTVSADMTYQSSSTTVPTPTPLIITTMATPKPTITSSRTVPTPWATAAATPESPVSIPAIIGGICLALIVVSRR